MSDQKSCLWKRKSSVKSTSVYVTQTLPSKSNEDEMPTLLSEKAELERDLNDLSDKLSIALSQCNANNELAHENAKMAQDAITSWEKAEAHALSLKEELEEALGRNFSCEERSIQLEAALKECLQQLRFVREEKEKRIHDVVSESVIKIAELQYENTELSEIIFLKEKVAEELNQKAANTNADMKELMNRLQSTEKRNASLEYKVEVLEKELHIGNEEKVKKIARLESECEKLRVLVRKRLPGPAAMTRMKNDVKMLERSPTKKDKLCILEEDNNALREKLTHAESQLEEFLSKTQIMKLSDSGYDDKASCAWSSASTMISDLTMSNTKSLEINLMDDFVEMEKLALVCEPISKLIQIIEKFNFQWKSSEAAAITQSFLHVCYGLLNGEADIGRFSCEVGSVLEWIINHCISLRDESTMKELCYQGAIPLLHIQTNLKEEIGKLKENITELESANMEVEEKLVNLSTQLSVAKIELDDMCEKVLSLEVESEYKTKCFEELEARFSGLQIQLQRTSMIIKDLRYNEDGKRLPTNWHVTSVSDNLAKCQETIFSVGRQLNKMQECKETITPKSTLLDKLLEEDKNGSPLNPPRGFVKGNINPMFESDWNGQSVGFRAFPLVPVNKKQRNGGMLKKMVWRKKKGKINKLALVFSSC